MNILVVSGLEQLRESIHEEIAERRSGVKVTKVRTLFHARAELGNVHTPRPNVIVLDASTPVNANGRQFDYVYTSTVFLVDARQRSWPPVLVVCARRAHFEYACESETTNGRIFATQRTEPAAIVTHALSIAAAERASTTSQ